MPGSVARVSSLLPKLLLLATVAVIGWPALAADAGEDQKPTTEAGAPPESPEAKTPTPKTPNPKTPDLCEALGAAATANELPVDFFTRLIWQESRFKPDAVSQKGAQGIAQFMPATARENGLDDPFNAA